MRLDIYTINPLSESDKNILMTEGRDSLAEYKRLEPNSLFTRNNTGNRYSIDVPTSSSLKKRGIRLSHLLVLNGDFLNDSTLSKYYWMELRGKNSETGLKTICISKSFDFDPLQIRDFDSNYKEYIYKMNYTYVQKFHYLSLLNSDNIEDYNVKNEAIMISAELPYGYKIDEPDWVFTNASTGKKWNVKDLQSPLVSHDGPLSNGYYDVEFRYKLGNEIKSIKRKSIFKI